MNSPELSLIGASPSIRALAEEIRYAARTAAWLQGTVRLTAVEATADGLVLNTADGTRVIWGRPVGADPQGEPTPDAKRDRLRAFAATPDGPREVDVRKVE